MLGSAPMPMRLDHLGIYVEDLDKALAFYCGVLGLDRPEVEDKPEHRMRIARVRLGDVELELIEAAVEDPLLRHLPDPGPGLYPIRVRVDSTHTPIKPFRVARGPP